MTTIDRSAATVLGLLLGAGVAAGGWFVGNGLFAARASERYVTVKGLAERQVPHAPAPRAWTVRAWARRRLSPPYSG